MYSEDYNFVLSEVGRQPSSVITEGEIWLFSQSEVTKAKKMLLFKDRFTRITIAVEEGKPELVC